MLRTNKKQGFTLVEILISVSIIAVTLTAMATLVIVTIRANTANMHKLQAYYLAEQGLDAMRNIRDSNWMQNYGWNMGDPLWGDSFESEEGGDIIYLTVDEDFESALNSQRGGRLTSSTIPWILEKIDSSDPESQSVLYELEETSFNRFTHDSSGGEKSVFSRYITVEYEGDSCDEALAKVSAVVVWNDAGKEKELVLTTYLTDWQTL